MLALLEYSKSDKRDFPPKPGDLIQFSLHCVKEIDWQGGYIAPDGTYIDRHGNKLPGFICPRKPSED
jgi:hypothetical protein